MSSSDFISMGLPFPVTQTGQPSCLVATDAGGNLKLTGQVASNTGAGSGGAGVPLRLTEFFNTDSTVHTASAPSGGFAITNTTGTSLKLTSEAANNNTKTDVAIYEYVIGSGYQSGNNVTVTVNANYVIGAGTLTTKTLAVAAYAIANDDTEGASLVATAAATLTGAAADYVFVITGATLVAGARLLLKLTTALTETASSNVTAVVNSVRLS